MYGRFVGKDDLCFDVGANLGNRVRAFRSLGCSVVAVEPQSFCVKALCSEFGEDSNVMIVPKALGSDQGSVELLLSEAHVLSTVSKRFIEATSESGRFRGVEWKGRETVEMTTLDQMVAEFGVPRFLKIDVEGFEPEVLGGLSQAVEAISFEWAPEMAEEAEACIDRLCSLADYEFNYSWGESMKFARLAWIAEDQIRNLIREFSGESQMFGDIYARLRHC